MYHERRNGATPCGFSPVEPEHAVATTAKTTIALRMATSPFQGLYWLVMPVFRPEDGFHPHALDLTTLLFVVGCFSVAFGWLLRRGHLLPVADPRLAESLAFENA